MHRSRGRSVVAVLALAATATLVATPATAAPARGTHPVRACGSVQALGRTLRVDIADGRLPIGCARARGVIRHYLVATKGRLNRTIRHHGETWTCYRSRAGRVGWDFHCSRLRGYAGDVTKQYVDIGAGRRR